MSRNHERKPKVFHDPPGAHFDPYFEEKFSDRVLHEKGLERKRREAMGEHRRERCRQKLEQGVVVIPASRAPVTLPALKWMKSP